jgi:hypothetical protein
MSTLRNFSEVACLNNAYPIKHKLKECAMMKSFMISGALSKGKKPKGDPGAKGVAPIPGEEAARTCPPRVPA